MPELPARPSAEHLRKQAKRIARERSIALAAAQRSVAVDYGFRSWPDLMRHVAKVRDEIGDALPLLAAVRRGDIDEVRALLANGENPRRSDGRETPLHVAARQGPLELVEILMLAGALDWQPDAAGRTALGVARRSRNPDRRSIVALLDRKAIDDPSFRGAVAAIHAGDEASLARLLEAEPRLLHERIVGPAIYRKLERNQYFLDPKLFWFVANNPTTVKRMPENIAAIAQIMIDRGAEHADLVYALELTMSSGPASEQGLQRPLMQTIVAAGAAPSRNAIFVAAAHRQLDALRALLEAGLPITAPIAAALGDLPALRVCLTTANDDDVQIAFGLAAINGHVRAAELALDAGADVNLYLPVHSHSTALHDAAGGGDLEMIALLLRRGARKDARDLLWDNTPLGWAIHQDRPAARAALEGS
jgi:ankyrin repeat protein